MPLEAIEDPNRIWSWMRRLQTHDKGLLRHSLYVGDLVLRFCEYLGYPPSVCCRLYIAGLLHDIGKLTIPPQVLVKSSSLTLEELELIKAHPHEGFRILLEEGVDDELLLRVARDHHERLNGTGYPRGLNAAELPRDVRIVILCDIYAALTETRPYGVSYTRDGALERMEMKRARLDEELLGSFAEMLRRAVACGAEQAACEKIKKPVAGVRQ